MKKLGHAWTLSVEPTIWSWSAGFSASADWVADRGLTLSPAANFWKPSTTTRSPGFRPSTTSQRPSCAAPEPHRLQGGAVVVLDDEDFAAAAAVALDGLLRER